MGERSIPGAGESAHTYICGQQAFCKEAVNALDPTRRTPVAAATGAGFER